MDVRCEKCKTGYEVDDARLTEAGITVRCTKRSHVFKVKRKVHVVTVAGKPEEGAREDAEAAAANAVKQAKTEVPEPVGLEVVRLWADVKAGKVTVFHAVVRIAYRQRLVPEPRKRATR